MAFESFAVAIGTSDTDVIECPATTEGAAVVFIGNITGSAVTVDVKIYRQDTATTLSIVEGLSIGANSQTKLSAPISLKAADKIVMVAASANAIRASGTFTYSVATPAETGFTPRGNWSNAANYNINDVVYLASDKKSYLARVANTNKSPDANPTEWQVHADQGEQGVDQDTIAIQITPTGDALTIGANKREFIMPYALDLTEVQGAVDSVDLPTGAATIIDVNEGGSTIMTTNKITIDDGESSSQTALQAPVLTDTVLAKGAVITFDIDQVGSTNAGKNAVVTLIGTRA